ncbi:UNVERIFIED_ORG: pyruvate/2-oxoglutarate dehydrogenase complex dihydrolipoamide acyltransferase (E2) component [Comamonas terrigena]
MTQFSDASIDQMARRYALQHRVSYAEALEKVVTITQEGGTPAATAAATQSAAPASPQAPTEAQIDQAAQRLARERGVDYITAVNMVMEHLKQHPTQSQAMAAPEADQRLHAAAMNYAQSRHVSYAEALSQVSATFSTANFSETNPEAVDAVRALESQEIEIFRAGSHVCSAGQRTQRHHG